MLCFGTRWEKERVEESGRAADEEMHQSTPVCLELSVNDSCFSVYALLWFCSLQIKRSLNAVCVFLEWKRCSEALRAELLLRHETKKLIFIQFLVETTKMIYSQQVSVWPRRLFSLLRHWRHLCLWKSFRWFLHFVSKHRLHDAGFKLRETHNRGFIQIRADLRTAAQTRNCHAFRQNFWMLDWWRGAQKQKAVKQICYLLQCFELYWESVFIFHSGQECESAVSQR